MEKRVVIEHIKHALYDMAFLDIKKASSGSSKTGAFILSSCFIDYMAGFVCGKETTHKEYKDFVRQYLPHYDPEKLWDDLRCTLQDGSCDLKATLYQRPGFYFTQGC